MQASTLIPAQQAQTGDLLFTHVTASDAGHVKLIIAVSGGTAHTVQAPTGDGVEIVRRTAGRRRHRARDSPIDDLVVRAPGGQPYVSKGGSWHANRG